MYARTVVLNTDGWKVSLTYYTLTRKGQHTFERLYKCSHRLSLLTTRCCRGQVTPKPFFSGERKIKMRIAVPFSHKLSHFIFLLWTLASPLLCLVDGLFFHFTADKQKESGLSVACSTWKGKKAEKHSTGCGFQLSVSEWGKHKSCYRITFWKATKEEIGLKERAATRGNESFFLFFLKVVGLEDE